jgi:hypothetical protein
MKFQVLTTARMSVTVLWYVAPCNLEDDGGSKHLWNVGQFLRDYTAQHPRRLSSPGHKPLGSNIDLCELDVQWHKSNPNVQINYVFISTLFSDSFSVT